ncbi:hypothetical protein BH11MYX2_BH11MYX2_12640 [soil metagenome]
MRTVAVVLMFAACDRSASVAVAPVVAAPLVAPTVGDAGALAKDDVRPPYLYLLSDTVQLAAAATWVDLDRSDVTVAKRVGTPLEIEAFVRQQYDAGTPPISAVAAWAHGSTAPALDEPLPPAAQDRDFEEGDDHGWTMYEPDEGKMGKKESDRGEGQYKMRVEPPGPKRPPKPWGQLNRYAGQLDPLGRPTRVAQVVGVTADRDQLAAMRSMIIAAPNVPATKLIDLVRITEGSIGVSHAGRIRPLRLQFLVRDDDGYRRDQRWLEVRVQPTGPVVVEAVADTPIESSLEHSELAAAITHAHDTRGIRGDVGLDVLVAPTVDAQRLVDVLAALETAGVKEIGLGVLPSTDELARRGHRIATMVFRPLRINGELDEKDVRRVLLAERARFLACHQRNPAAGTPVIQFFITPAGTVSSANASPSSISSCLSDITASLRFPSRPTGVLVAAPLVLTY